MSTLLQHANIAIKMLNNGIDLSFINHFSIKDIINCCYSIEKCEIIKQNLNFSKLIKEQLIKNKKFIDYLKVVYEKGLNVNKFEMLIVQTENHKENITDYPIEDIINVITNEELYHSTYYDYLKYFTHENIFFRKIITSNLNHFHEQRRTHMEDLTESERELFKLNYLDNYNLIPGSKIKEVYEFLANNEELRNLIDFLNSRKLYLPLDIPDYEKLNENPKQIRTYIEKIANKIQNDDVTYEMLLYWLKNACNLYDLKTINEKIDNMELEKLKNIFSSKTSYINFIYGNKLKRFTLESIYGYKEELIIYAIRENKNSFLKTIEENMEMFLSIPSNSILYNENFYTKYINLNEITVKHLEMLKTMLYDTYSNLGELKEQKYTFEEIKSLYDMKIPYIKLYNELLDLKVDAKLLRLRQLSKKKLLDNIQNDDDIKKIAEKIKIKPLYLWLENDFNKIFDIRAEDIIQIFIHFDSLEKFIYDIRNRKELLYILRNADKVCNYENLKNIKENIETIDNNWISLKKALGFSEEFLQKYSDNIKEFLLNNGAELAYTYYTTRNKEQKEAFKLIIKAEIMGEFKKLKYHTDDLKKEIDFELKEYQIKEWSEENIKITEGKYEIQEYDDFYHTMILGEYPKKTCLSYISGGYNNCLLACFDSNKKILYAKINDKIVARAMVRLTKGTYNMEDANSKSLQFIDVESNTAIINEKRDEKLTLFLERPYISGITEDEEKKVQELFIQLLKAKAKKMNALLVLSRSYMLQADEQFVSSRYYMYISKSKSSSQYLDSLSGQATVTDEGQYKENSFLIWKPDINQYLTLNDNIKQE